MNSRTSLQQNRIQSDPQRLLEQGLEEVREALNALRFGSVVLTVHEGRLVQIDVTEKRRLMPG